MKSQGVVAIIKKGDRFLLLKEKRSLLKGHWAPPHGRLENRESEEEAVIREVREETGLEVVPQKKIIETKADTKIKRVSWWEARITGGKLIPDKKEVADYGWFSIEKLKKLKLYPGTKKFFEKYKDAKN